MKNYLSEISPEQREIVAQWITERHPSWAGLSEADAQHNAYVMGEIYAQHGWDMDVAEPQAVKGSLDAAFVLGLETGELREPKPPNSDMIGVVSPIPTLQGNGAVAHQLMSESEWMASASAPDLKKYLEAKYAKPRPPSVLIPQSAHSEVL